MRMRRLWPLLLIIGLTACGPDIGLTVGVREDPVNVVIGDQRKPSPTAVVLPPPLDNPLPSFPPFVIQPPTALVAPVATPLPPTCPNIGPFDYPKVPGTNSISKPPVTAGYDFRQGGKETSGTSTYTLPSIDHRTYGNVIPDPTLGPQSFTFDVTQQLFGDKVVTTYLVNPSGSAPTKIPGGPSPAPSSPPGAFIVDPRTAGMYISSIVDTKPDGSQTQFSPANAVMLAPFPLTLNASWSSQGADGVHSTTMTVQGQIVSQHDRVDACGTVVDAWRIHLTGNVADSHTQPTSANQPGLSLDNLYEIAPQYGGVIVGEELDEQGSTDVGAFALTVNAGILAEPRVPQ